MHPVGLWIGSAAGPNPLQPSKQLVLGLSFGQLGLHWGLNRRAFRYHSKPPGIGAAAPCSEQIGCQSDDVNTCLALDTRGDVAGWCDREEEECC